MSDSTNAILQRAYELIERDELERARSILTPLLETDAENPSLWWVYSHSLRDRSIGQLALDRVIALDPSYPGAGELKADVLELQEQDDDLLGVETDANSTAQSASDISIDDWEDLQQPALDAESEPAGTRRGFVLLIVILLIVATGTALVASGAVNLGDLLSGILTTPEPAVIVVVEPTDEPAVAEVEIEPSMTSIDEATTLAAIAVSNSKTDTESTAETTALVSTVTGVGEPTSAATEAATAKGEPSPRAGEPDTPLAAFVRDVAESISEFEVIQQSSGRKNTLLGNSLVLQLCAIPGQEFNERLGRVMNAVVDYVADIPEDIEGVVAGLRNCDDPDAIQRRIGVTVSVIKAYADGDISAKEFQRAWRPLS